MPGPLRVLHLTGSPVDPLMAELSRLYAGGALEATADPDRYRPVVVHVEIGGKWRVLRAGRIDGAALAAATPLPPVAALADLEVDVVVPQMFCLPGMTAYRDMWAPLGVPLVGNTGAVMALAADKPKARAVVAAAGVDVPAGQVVGRGERPDLPLPVVVKPADADNSAGVTLVRHRSELDDALAAALAAGGGRALVEAFVPAGREVRVGVVELDGAPVCLPLEEYRLDADRPVRTAADKLGRPDGATLSLMAKTADVAWIVDPSDPVTGPVGELALACHRALGCRHHSLFDVRIDPDGRPWFLEASPYCSFSPKSVLAVMAAAAGIPLASLFGAQVALALGASQGDDGPIR